MAHQVWPRRRRRIHEVARRVVTGEWQRANKRPGQPGLMMSAATVERYRDLLVELGVLIRIPARGGRHPNGTRFGERFTAGPQFADLFKRGPFSRAGLRIWLVRQALVRVFGRESVPQTSFVLRTSLVSSRRTVEKVPAAPANDGSRASPPDVGIAAGYAGADPSRRERGPRAQVEPQTVNRGRGRPDDG